MDRDDFIRNLHTVLLDDGRWVWTRDGTVPAPTPPLPLSPSASGREPVLTLAQMKIQCHIELDQTEEDDLLLQYEMAARIHTENVTRRPGQLDASAPENIKQAMLVLVAHMYRNREALGSDKMVELPLAYCALIATEVEYSNFY
jgi:hypothetical protein